MKIGIIGGGISGISSAKILSEHGLEVKVFEKEGKIGGLISCDFIDGVTFHKVGGHVFNSKNEDVKNWFFSNFDKENEFYSLSRNAKIFIQNSLVNYPIENHLYQLPKKLTQKIIYELVNSEQNKSSSLGEYLRNTFGETLFEIYFKPYNEKIWDYDLSRFPISWLENKLPMPSLDEIFFNNIFKENESKMVHSKFNYPKNGGSQFLIEKLGAGINIECESKIESITKSKKYWMINGEKFDKIIFTGNVKSLPKILKNFNLDNFDSSIFPSHGTSTVLAELQENDLSWLYLPDSHLKAHRVIMTGNFSPFNNGNYGMTGTIEFTKKLNYNEIKSQCNKTPFFKNILALNEKEETYVIQTQKSRREIFKLKNILNQNGFYLLGRFAEWEYYNMDTAIEQSLNVCKQIIKSYG